MSTAEVDRLKRITRPLYDRSAALAAMGIWVGTSAPVVAITYAQWLAGSAGYWAWIDTTPP